MNAPDPRHWPLNSRFGVFRTLWMHLGLFGCHTKLGVKRAELVQKFVPWSRVWIFHNERTQSTPLDPKLMFHSVSYYFGAFGTVRLCYKTQCKNRPNWCKSSCHEVASEFFATNAPDPPYRTLNWRFGAFHTIWLHLRPFGCLTKLSAKRAELVQKFVPRSRVELFAMNAPDPPHWTLNWCFGTFRTIWVHLGPFGCLTKFGAKRGELVQKLVPRCCVGIFSQLMHPINPIVP